MKHFTAALSAVLFLTFFSFTSTASTNNFTDLKSSDWFYDTVQVLVDKDIISGYGDGQFHPNDMMQVDQFIKTMVVALGENPGNGSEYWAQTYIDQAIAMGILKENDFDDYTAMITRAEMAMLSVRTLTSLEGEADYDYEAIVGSSLYRGIIDRDDIKDEVVAEFICHAYESGLITGYPDNTYRPNDGLKRSEACTVIQRVIDASKRKPYEPDEWAVRADEIYDDTGYVVFTGESPNVAGEIVSAELLRSENGKYVFGSFLNYNDTIISDGVWSIFFGIVSAEHNIENKNQQLYELEYILSELWKVEDQVISEITSKIEQRLEVGSTSEKTWTINDGAVIRFNASVENDRLLTISGLNFTSR